jgi:hypothetical protein
MATLHRKNLEQIKLFDRGFGKEINMKVKCIDCGFTYERKVLWEGMCSMCDCSRWVMSLEDSEKLFNKVEIAELHAMDKKNISKPNIKSCQEMQQKACKGKTIMELWKGKI